ncbi:NADH:flavin oxidoreductase/NADH oxidase family protein [Panacagrimonas sp.]|uniref:NADH:flavin oxidoreductase/NADH oxidase family protein n=1 Tax=Panacagrimonas sp. TaxID=2480088 RepID=UPI003B51F451
MQNLLAQPLKLPCGVVLSNRIAKAAMTEGLADEYHCATDRHERLYRGWSQGGAGLLLTGNVQVDRSHLERPGNLVIDNNGGLEALKAYARAGTEAGNHLWMQINHPGRQTPGELNGAPLAPSAIPLRMAGDKFAPPRAMTEAQILDVIRRWAHVARTAREAGFTGVQIHAAHGYLLSQFLSPLSNQRTDAWGGSLENRARALLEVYRAIRKATGPDFPISVKMNSADFQKGGFDSDECLHVVRWLHEAGVDLLEISGGNYEQLQMLGSGEGEGTDGSVVRESTRKREAYFLEFAQKIRPVCDIPLMITGGFRSRAAMTAALESGGLDVVGLGRPLCVDQDLPRKLLDGSVEMSPAHERNLKLDPAVVPDVSDQATRDLIEAFGGLGWYCLQLIYLGHGKSVDTQMSVYEAFVRYQENEATTLAQLRDWKPVAA